MQPHPSLIFEECSLEHASPEMMDRFWSLGWRHFGTEFFRYSLSFNEHGQQTIQPLRIDLKRFVPSKSQRRVLRRNAELEVRFVPASLHRRVCEMFQKHKGRFTFNVPNDLRDFLGDPPGQLIPCWECQVWQGREMVAASFMETSRTAVSSVYGLFDLAQSSRSLGIFTLLMEIDYGIRQGLDFLYSGYATLEPSHYDYKKKFAGLEIYDWAQGKWVAEGAENDNA